MLKTLYIDIRLARLPPGKHPLGEARLWKWNAPLGLEFLRHQPINLCQHQPRFRHQPCRQQFGGKHTLHWITQHLQAFGGVYIFLLDLLTQLRQQIPHRKLELDLHQFRGRLQAMPLHPHKLFHRLGRQRFKFPNTGGQRCIPSQGLGGEDEIPVERLLKKLRDAGAGVRRGFVQPVDENIQGTDIHQITQILLVAGVSL